MLFSLTSSTCISQSPPRTALTHTPPQRHMPQCPNAPPPPNLAGFSLSLGACPEPSQKAKENRAKATCPALKQSESGLLVAKDAGQDQEAASHIRGGEDLSCQLAHGAPITKPLTLRKRQMLSSEL